MPPPHTLPHPATTAPAGAVLITGASTGIGAAAAVALAECGYFVFAGVRAPAREVPLVAACGGPARAAALRLDVADPASIAAATLTIATALESAGGPSPAAPPRRLAALVNNAGVSFPGPLLAQPPGELDATLAVNLVGALAVTRAVGPLLGIADAAGVPGLGPAWRRAPGSAASKGTRLPAPALAPLPPLAPPTHGRGRPVIINVSSVAGKVAGPYMGAYAASKHGLEGASDALRREVAPFGVEVVVLGERERERERERKNVGRASSRHISFTRAQTLLTHPLFFIVALACTQNWAPLPPPSGRKQTPWTWASTHKPPGRPLWPRSCA
jgi:NAD(P)-dependent dehydrogenase (short-subunit alcohol dehydrogenase family)